MIEEEKQQIPSASEGQEKKTRPKRSGKTKTTEAEKAADAKEAVPEKPLSEIFEELDTLLEHMEAEESLEKSFLLYKKGVQLLQMANDSIDRVEKQVKVLDDEGFLS